MDVDLGESSLNENAPLTTWGSGLPCTPRGSGRFAGYIKPFLPTYLEIPALVQIDRVAFIDKEIRKGKGHWEKKILESLSRFSRSQFHKRMFTADNEQFELDAATPRVFRRAALCRSYIRESN
jgi:hypothetical protein